MVFYDSTPDLAAALKSWRGCTAERPRGTITQREAAERLGIPYDTLREIERGGSFRYPRLLLHAMENISSGSIDDLCG